MRYTDSFISHSVVRFLMGKVFTLFEESIKLKKKVLKSGELLNIEVMANLAKNSILNGGKIMFCGNGGSAADAQHLAAEMLIRLKPENNRKGIAALALAQDTSTITACGNDFSYKNIFERMVQSLGKEGDILIGISTSGNSENIILAMKAAKDMNIKVFGFLGSGGGKAFSLCDVAFVVPSNNTGRIQETHITAGHALAENIEDQLIEDGFLDIES